MAERPYIICHMTSSIDGRLHPSRYTATPDGTPDDLTAAYEAIHDALAGDAWLVGRTTMAEMAKGEPHPPADAGAVQRPIHIVDRDARSYAIAVDTQGKLHFKSGEVGGDQAIVLLGGEVDDTHLAELADDKVSYVVSSGPEIELGAAMAVLRREFGIERLLLEGGGTINGAFLAEGLVDELSVVVAPALDGGTGVEGIVGFGRDGLAGKVRLSLDACDRRDHGIVHLRYKVLPGD